MNENNIRNSTYEYAVKQIIDYTAIYGGDRHNIWIAIYSLINLLRLTQARNTQFQSNNSLSNYTSKRLLSLVEKLRMNCQS